VENQHVACALTTSTLRPQHVVHVGDARFAQALAPVGLVPHRHDGWTGPADLACVKDLVRLDRAVVLDQVVVVNPALPAVRTLHACFLCSSVSDFADHKRIGAKNIHHVAFLKHRRFSWNCVQLVLLGCATLSAGCDKLVVDLLDDWVLHVGLVCCTRFGCTAGLHRWFGCTARLKLDK